MDCRRSHTASPQPVPLNGELVIEAHATILIEGLGPILIEGLVAQGCATGGARSRSICASV